MRPINSILLANDRHLETSRQIVMTSKIFSSKMRNEEREIERERERERKRRE